jgi:hypothetical protein
MHARIQPVFSSTSLLQIPQDTARSYDIPDSRRGQGICTNPPSMLSSLFSLTSLRHTPAPESGTAMCKELKIKQYNCGALCINAIHWTSAFSPNHHWGKWTENIGQKGVPPLQALPFQNWFCSDRYVEASLRTSQLLHPCEMSGQRRTKTMHRSYLNSRIVLASISRSQHVSKSKGSPDKDVWPRESGRSISTTSPNLA